MRCDGKPKYSDKFFASRTHGELCTLATQLTDVKYTFRWTHDELIEVIKKELDR